MTIFWIASDFLLGSSIALVFAHGEPVIGFVLVSAFALSISARCIDRLNA